MKFMKKSLLGAAVAAALGFAATAQAGVVIDLFNEPLGTPQTVSSSAIGTFGTGQTTLRPTTEVIGGYRDLSVVRVNNPLGSNPSGAATVSVEAGSLTFSNAASIVSRGVVTWDGSTAAGDDGLGVNSAGLGGVDLTAGGGASQFLTSILFADDGFNYKITVWDMDGDKSVLSAGVQFAIPEGGPGVAAGYLFAWFNLASGTYCNGVAAPPACTNPFTELDFNIQRTTGAFGDGMINFANIGALQFEAQGVRGNLDLALGGISTVPEPGALALVGIALMGAGLATRRRAALKG